MLLVVLCVQGILAAHACVAPDASAAGAVAMKPVVEAMPCHESATLNANECLMHCTQSDQVNLDLHMLEAASVDGSVLHVPMPQARHLVPKYGYAPVVLNTGPPLSIRFCSFLI